MKDGGAFGENNPRAAPMGQKSQGTTTNNEDTSGASTLPPAAQASARDSVIEGNESSELNAGIGRGKDEGRGPTYATVASGTGEKEQQSSTNQAQDRSTDQTQDSAAQREEYPGTFEGDDRNGTLAPTYVNASELREAEQKPKGKNLTEGGFDDDAKNTNSVSEIGTEDDPGRLAEEKFERINAQPGSDAGGPRQSNAIGDNVRYGALEDTEA
jgi:hypothetical protein